VRNIRLAAIAGVTVLLAACATASPSPEPPIFASSSGAFAAVLHLCNGDHIDNAPLVDRKKHVIGYEPFIRVAGATLARAPVRRGCFSSGFGRRHDRPGRHNGIDLSTGHPHAVYAAGDGVAEEMRVAGGYGNMILIRHNSRVQTRYGHLSSYSSDLHIGHKVRMGEVIGSSGSTGNANAVILHYEIIINGVPRDPMAAGW
jgi:murein DD-endopeptidase MepM/ murein hydrolase activator NlpD